MVEYDGETENPATKNISLLQSITFESDPIPIPNSHDAQTLPSRLPSSRSSSSPCRASPTKSSPSRTSPTPPSPSSPQSVRRKFTQRRGKRGPGFTVSNCDCLVVNNCRMDTDDTNYISCSPPHNASYSLPDGFVRQVRDRADPTRPWELEC